MASKPYQFGDIAKKLLLGQPETFSDSVCPFYLPLAKPKQAQQEVSVSGCYLMK